MRLLACVILRALGVTVLLATVLLPAADHHALDRLVGIQLPGQDAHWMLIHHHHQPARTSDLPASASTSSTALVESRLDDAVAGGSAASATLVAASPPADAVVFAMPVAAALLCIVAFGVWSRRLFDPDRRLPSTRSPSVPVPPPRSHLLLAAA